MMDKGFTGWVDIFTMSGISYMEPSGFAGTKMGAIWKRIMGTGICLDIKCFCV